MGVVHSLPSAIRLEALGICASIAEESAATRRTRTVTDRMNYSVLRWPLDLIDYEHRQSQHVRLQLESKLLGERGEQTCTTG